MIITGGLAIQGVNSSIAVNVNTVSELIALLQAAVDAKSLEVQPIQDAVAAANVALSS